MRRTIQRLSAIRPRSAGRAVAAVASLVLVALPLAPAGADAPRLMPQMQIALSVTQWVPSEGSFRRWPELERTVVVDAAGTITLPVIGPVEVAGRTGAEVGHEIAASFRRKVGLNADPDVVVSIVAYPPVFVVGEVATPGEYAFRPGMTVLQALSLSGGERRQADGEMKDAVTLLGEQEDVADEILRLEARIARLEAEAKGADTIEVPPALAAPDAGSRGRTVLEQEQRIFTARANALDRQRTALDELTALLEAEIDALGQKSAMLDEAIGRAEAELSGVNTLVDRGVVTVARRSALESALSDLRSQRLDQTTATMRARQGINGAERDRIALLDERQARIAEELQDARATLERARVRREVSARKLLLTDTGSPDAGGLASLSFTIVRDVDGHTAEIGASELTPLAPGDVLRVGRRSAPAQPADVSGPAPAVAPQRAAALR